jgi:heme exporter protein C
MFAFLANPQRFMAFSKVAAPLIGAAAFLLLAAGLWQTFSAPDDYQQGATVRMMFIHVPAAWMAMFTYVCLGVASFLSLVFRHTLADAAAKACAPLGATFTALALITGSLWGQPMWGTWWVWDARLTSMLVLLLLWLAYIALRGAIDDETKAGRAAAILALVGAVNLPIIHYSVVWWNTLHEGSANFMKNTGSGHYLAPLALMALGYTAAFGSLWLVRIRAELYRRRAVLLALRAAET